VKKILIIVFTLIVALAALPVIGNKFTQEALNSKIEDLKSFGLEVKKNVTESSYLSTKTHYEFLLSEKFVAHASVRVDKRFPSYVSSAFEGVVVGVDLEYSNFPLSKAVSIDLYPLTLSSRLAKEIKADDENLHNFISSFLQAKGILYHVNYDVLSTDFDGYVKDVNEEYELSDGTKISTRLSSAIYRGNGDLMAPKTLTSSVKEISMEAENEDEVFKFNLTNFSGSLKNEPLATSSNGVKIESVKLVLARSFENFKLEASGVNASISLNEIGEKSQMISKNSVQKLEVKSKKLNFRVFDFNSDVALCDLNKTSLEKLRALSSLTARTDPVVLQRRMEESLYELLSHGMTFNVIDFSFKNVSLDNNETLNGFSAQSSFELEADENFAQKMKYLPILLVQKINTDVKVKISNKLFSKLTNSQPMLGAIRNYAKTEGESLVYSMSFRDDEFKINGEALRF